MHVLLDKNEIKMLKFFPIWYFFHESFILKSLLSRAELHGTLIDSHTSIKKFLFFFQFPFFQLFIIIILLLNAQRFPSNLVFCDF